MGPLPSHAASYTTLPLAPSMPNSDEALLLWVEGELRRRRVTDASAGSDLMTMAMAPTAVEATAPAAAVAVAVSQAVQLGFRALSEAFESAAMGPLAGKPLGAVLPGVTSARVGLLPGLRTADMLKYNGVRGYVTFLFVQGRGYIAGNDEYCLLAYNHLTYTWGHRRSRSRSARPPRTSRG